MTPLSETATSEVHYDPDCSPEQLEQVLAALARWGRRTSPQVLQHRQSNRHDYPVTVIVEPAEPVIPRGRATFRQIFHVSARNISRAGIGLVAPAVFIPRVPLEVAPLLRSETVFREGAAFKVSWAVAQGNLPTVRAAITRVRPVHFGFLEVGLRFLAREG